jgi:hypothetical protein
MVGAMPTTPLRSTLTTAALSVALLGVGAGSAAARPNVPLERQVEAANHEATMLALALKHERDAASPPQSARIVRVPVASNDFDWVDGAIGAGVTAAALLGVAGVDAARRQPSVS